MNIVIATTTSYKDIGEVRAQLALKVMDEARKYDYPIVVVDDSSEPIAQMLLEQGATLVIPQEKGTTMGAGRRQAINAAARLGGEDGYVVWMEPEKVGFIPHVHSIVDHMAGHDVGLMIPGRVSITSYPIFQQCAEVIGNRAFHLRTGRKLDVWFGPRIFRSSDAHVFCTYQGEYGDRWDSIFIPVIRALALGLPTDEFLIPFIYPEVQRDREAESFAMVEKRLFQLTTLVNAIGQEADRLSM